MTEVKELKKYELYIDDPGLKPYRDDYRFYGFITKQQAEEFLKELSRYETTPESCCFGHIRAVILTYTEVCVNIASKQADKYSYNRPKGQLTISFDGCKCKCPTALCLRNIERGKCKDELVCNTLGKILFNKAYFKEK